MQQTPGSRADDRWRQAGPVRDERLDGTAQPGMHFAAPACDRTQRAGHGPAGDGGEAAPASRYHGRSDQSRDAAQPGRAKHCVNNQVPGDYAEKRKSEDVDAAGFLERREKHSGYQGAQQQQHGEPRRPAHAFEQGPEHRETLIQRGSQPPGALGKCPRVAASRPRGIEVGGRKTERAQRLARRLLAIGQRQQGVRRVGFLDSLDQQDDRNRLGAHRARMLPQRENRLSVVSIGQCNTSARVSAALEPERLPRPLIHLPGHRVEVAL